MGASSRGSLWAVGGTHTTNTEKELEKGWDWRAWTTPRVWRYSLPWVVLLWQTPGFDLQMYADKYKHTLGT